jgi:hypothetical protein
MHRRLPLQVQEKLVESPALLPVVKLLIQHYLDCDAVDLLELEGLGVLFGPAESSMFYNWVQL